MKEKPLYRMIYWAAVIFFLIFTLGPIVYLFLLSITPESEILHTGGPLIPKEIFRGNYSELLRSGSDAGKSLFTGLKNSGFISSVTVLTGVPICILAAYAFYRYRFRGGKSVLTALLLTMAVPLFTTIIPIYAIFAQYGLLDSEFWISVIYITSMVPITIWIMIGYFRTIPKEIFEAAVLDGADEKRIFLNLVLPLSLPIIITSVLMMFIMSWNQYQIPMILSTSPDKKVVTMIMSDFMSRDGISYGIIAACGILAVLPPAILAVLFRRFLVSGLSSGSVKG